jgi:inositol hexakisphosphate/diphosphoinositol-pentakisphosphate kinase
MMLICIGTYRCKAYLETNLQMNKEYTDEVIDSLFPGAQMSVHAGLRRLGNPQVVLQRIHELIGSLCKQMEVYIGDTSDQDIAVVKTEELGPLKTDEMSGSTENESGTEEYCLELYSSETFSLMHDRWQKLNKDFKNKKTGMYDLTKVPDIYDMVRYDVLHNSHIGLSGIEELLALARDFADVVVPQEYGISKEDKAFIGSKMCSKFCIVTHQVQSNPSV